MGQSPEGSSYNVTGKGVPLLNGPTEFGAINPIPKQWTTEPTKFAEAGDILLCVRGATTGRKNMADQQYCIGRGLAAIRGNSQRALTGYLWFVLDFITATLLEEASGSTFPNLPGEKLKNIKISIPPLREQERITAILNEQMASVNKIREVVERQIELTTSLIDSYLRESLTDSNARSFTLSGCLTEVSRGVGESWENYRVIGATRSGLAPAKAPIGKSPERYKLVDKGTIFYNPMRILIGSIGMVDEDDEPGITSPDYVVFKSQNGIVHPRWLYYWLRSSFGAAFIKTLARGAVRERMLFQRLAKAEMLLPSWDTQVEVAEKLSAIAKLRQSLEEQLAATNDLPEKLLHRAFNGEV